MGMAFRLSERAGSFRHAFRGIGLVVRTQHNTWIHLVATIGVVALGWWTGLAPWEWCAVTFAIGLVWVAEALNTALEFLADEVSREKRELIGKAKAHRDDNRHARQCHGDEGQDSSHCGCGVG